MKNKRHEKILELIADIRRRTKASLPEPHMDKNGAHRRGRSLVRKDLAMIEADIADLRSELSRLRIHFVVNNYLSGRRAPASASGQEGGADTDAGLKENP